MCQKLNQQPELKSPSDCDSILEVAALFKDKATCLKYIEAWLWDNKMKCPDCGSEKVWRFKDGEKFKCSQCNRVFSVLVGTIFEATKIALPKWFMAIYLISANKKGINSCALGRQLKITQKSAWFLLHRIRKAMGQSDLKLSGLVQSDEAFIGGKNRNRHKAKRVKYGKGRNYPDKTPVLGMIEQGGKVKAVVLSKISAREIRQSILTNVEPQSVLVSDDYHAYKQILPRYYDCHSVNHKKGQYVNDQGFTTNSIENFWTHFKNMIRGIYIKMSRKHLQKYCDELCFRWNTMKLSEGYRMYELMKKLNCRLSYKQLIKEYE